MTEEYQDIQLLLSEDDEPTQKPVKAKGKYTLSDKAKASRIENLRKGREKRHQLMLQRKTGQVIDQEDYTDESSDDGSPPAPPTPQRRTKAYYPPAAPQPKQKQSNVQMQRLEEMMAQLLKQKTKKRMTHKTVIVPQQQLQQQPVERKAPHPQQEMAKKKIFDLF